MTKEWTWQAEREALLKRIAELEALLIAIDSVCDRPTICCVEIAREEINERAAREGEE